MCVLLEGFRKFLVDPYYEPLSWFMIGAKTNVTIGYMPYYFETIVPGEVW